MKQATVIYAGTGVQLWHLLRKSKIEGLLSKRDLEKVMERESNKRIVILKHEKIIKITISSPHYRMTTKNARDEMRKMEAVEVLVYPQNNKKIQELLSMSTEIVEPKNLFIAYFY
jgi:hypothetical protein